jgi:hypothetical protein
VELKTLVRWSLMLAALFSMPAAFAAGHPILLVGNNSNPFSFYYSEILRVEGFNDFDAVDISIVTSTTLGSYDVVIIGEGALSAAQVAMFSNWVNAGGSLIAMRPDKQLAPLLGISDAGTTLSDGYLLVNTSTTPGAGIVGQPIQFHGTADQYLPNGSSTVATLYSSATRATSFSSRDPPQRHWHRRKRRRIHLRSGAIDRLYPPG